MSEKLVEIAQGGPFDIVEAIRLIAQHMVVVTAPLGRVDEGGKPLFEHVVNLSPSIMTLSEVLSEKVVGILDAAGYTSIKSVQDASDDKLLALKGIGDSSLVAIRAATAESGGE